ncbi:MAG: hypothetical protein QMD02_06715 [Bacteroidales bacterium]|nr:hypothetical protein [Bacteroidales bacterium]
MKKIHLFLFFNFLIFNLIAQNFIGIANVGFNISQVDGDEIYGFRKFGANIGPSVMYSFGKNNQWQIFLETNFSQKGSYQKYPNTYVDTMKLPYYNLRLNYVEIPFLILYNDNNLISFGGGFSYGRLTNAKEYEYGNLINYNTLRGPYDANDFEVIAEVRFRIYQKLYGNVRYSYSIDKIRTRSYDNGVDRWTRNQYNNVISIRLLWYFNQKLEDKPLNKK